MNKEKPMMDEIRKGTLLQFIEQEYGKTHKPAKFRYEGDGLRFITDLNTVIDYWTPKQVEEALRDLEASGRVKLTHILNATHTSGFHVKAYPRAKSKPREQSFDEVITLINTDDEFCAALVQDVYDTHNGHHEWLYGIKTPELPDCQIFYEMGKLMDRDGITERQLAICRMPDENGIPRLARYKQRVDELDEIRGQITLLFDLQGLFQAGLSPIEFIDIDGLVWLLDDGLPSEDFDQYPVETLEALEKAGDVTVRRDGYRVKVTGVFLDEQQHAAFQNLISATH